jgi:DNA-binding IclR family transcriptional regulator
MENLHGHERDSDHQLVMALTRGFDVLRCYSATEPVLQVKEIARRAGIPTPTVSRLTYTLARLGYLQRVGLGRYQLGPAVLSIAYPLFAATSVRRLARPLMEELASHCGSSVSMDIRDRLNVIFIESCRSTMDSNPLVPDIGMAIPIARGTSGSALLAACAAPEREQVLNQIKVKMPEDYALFRERLEQGLREIETRGFSASPADLDMQGVSANVPMRCTGDGIPTMFNCSVAKTSPKARQLEDDVGPRLVDMVRKVEAAIARR